MALLPSLVLLLCSFINLCWGCTRLSHCLFVFSSPTVGCCVGSGIFHHVFKYRYMFSLPHRGSTPYFFATAHNSLYAYYVKPYEIVIFVGQKVVSTDNFKQFNTQFVCMCMYYIMCVCVCVCVCLRQSTLHILLQLIFTVSYKVCQFLQGTHVKTRGKKG